MIRAATRSVARGSVGAVTSSDEIREPDDVDPGDPADAASAPSVDASDDAATQLRRIESVPLAERAPGYQELADRLRAELERSDPSRDPN